MFGIAKSFDGKAINVVGMNGGRVKGVGSSVIKARTSRGFACGSRGLRYDNNCSGVWSREL